MALASHEPNLLPALERRKPKNVVEAVAPGSAAEQAGLRVGDRVVAVNAAVLRDIVDWRFHTAGEAVHLAFERDGTPQTVQIAKGYDEDLGLRFADDLFDHIHICKNKCVFCFLYQQPKGLRSSLYIKDDDFRLSFLHGNYVTLTNLRPGEWARILAQKLSPMFVSIHATDPDVRGRMLGRKGPEPILPQLAQLADAKIHVHGQIVLCPGYNDDAHLERTVDALAALHPDARQTYGGVLSLAVVPVGVTQFRDRQAPLTTVDARYANALLDWAEARRQQFLQTLGSRFLFLSDEFYLNAGRDVPPRGHYEGFPQLEDGVGLVRLFLEDVQKLARSLPKRVATPRSFTLVTGEMPARLVGQLADTLNRVENIAVNVCVVHNHFFEGNISVAGLLTGKDIADALTVPGFMLHETVIVPSVALRDGGDLFLDEMRLDELARRVGRPVVSVERMPSAAATAILR